MCKRRLICLLLVVLMLLPPVRAAKPPYGIKVNRSLNTVTIYTLDEMGNYTVPVRAMICSTARKGYRMPMGTFYLENFRSPWRLMVDGTYGQYATCFEGNYLFHSICYESMSHDGMVTESYNKLGQAASMGCVRLQTADAKWIYDNCPVGTPVTIYEDPSNPGPLGKPEKQIEQITPAMENGWDPTDPAEGNPWRQLEADSLNMLSRLDLVIEDTGRLPVNAQPRTALVLWSSSDEAVARVEENGVITAVSPGIATVTARSVNGVQTQCLIRVYAPELPLHAFSELWIPLRLRQALKDALTADVCFFG